MIPNNILQKAATWVLINAIILTVLFFYFSTRPLYSYAHKSNNCSCNESKVEYVQVTREQRRPLILTWTTFHGRSDPFIISKMMKEKCRGCDFTTDKKDLDKANVLIFHGCDLNANNLAETRSDQFKVFFMRESPGRNNQFYRDWDTIPMSYFNTTITYRGDADYAYRYVTLPLLGSNPNLTSFSEEQIDITLSKKKQIAFSLISNCNAPSNRGSVIKELAKYIKVNSYGDCSGRGCNADCEGKLIESHYFYLAFENSICDEYATEKLGRFKKLIVPIVLKRSVVPKHIPQDAFIAVDDFCSLEKLGEYLNFLVNNTDIYKEYFSWTRRYSPDDEVSALCRFCDDYGHEKVKTRDYSQYHTVRDFFSPKQCDNGFGTRAMKNRCDLNISAITR